MNPEVFFFHDKTVEIKRRAFKRSIGMTLQVNGKILISAPKSVPLRKIHQFLEKNREWITSNLQKYEELRQRYPKKQYSEGEKFLFLGETLKLYFVKSARSRISIHIEDRYLICSLPAEIFRSFDSCNSHPELSRHFLRFYEGEGRAYLRSRIKTLSEQMDLHPKAISFRSQKTRWGSCSSEGKLSLNWRLIITPPAVIDYVIVHELAHLRHHNHSEKFWKLVSQYSPDYCKFRDWLKAHQFEADFLSRQSELHS